MNLSIEGVLGTLSGNLNKLIPLLVLVATVLFLFGVVRYIAAAGDEEKTKEARRLIIYGIIGLAIIIAVWGLVAVVIDFIFNTNTIPNIPGGNVVNTI